jgi:superfamily II DNA or RNA helicase
MLTWDSYFQTAVSASNHQKGLDFELLTVKVLKSYHVYTSKIEKVWHLREGVPSDLKRKLNLPSSDEGIDIIAKTFDGDYWAIQCKFKASKEPPTMKELSTFNSLAHTHCKNISLAILFHTGERGVRKKHLMGEKYSEVGLEFWLGLSQEEWNTISTDSKRKVKPIIRKPREHQKNAIKLAQQHFIKDNSSRGRLIMPCGTGKSLTAFWIANGLKAKSVIVAVPSLNLIKQSIQDWTAEFIAQNENPRPDWQVICSDESTSKIEDEFVSDIYSHGIPSTTNIEEIKNFLKKKSDGRKIIFTTYQSSERLAQAAKSLKYTFDLAILDEAHKTVGIKSKSFATLLSDENINIRQRMFMTATERVLKGTNDDVLSMDDEAVYGKRFYQLTFKEAIHSSPQIISDYKILTIAVSNSQIQELIQKNKLLSDKKNRIEEDEAQSLAAAIALRQATEQYGIKHAISFHRSIKAAESFTNLNVRLNASKVDKVDISSYHISSKKTAGQRSQLLDDFKNDKLALMTNAKCLTEGVNVPAIDCVLFADPKQSVVDIVQAAGRALRVNEGKKFGYIMMPLIVPDDMELLEFTESTPFKQVARIVADLSTQDERLVEELRLKSEGKTTAQQRIDITGYIPAGMKLDISSFVSSIEAKYWEKVGRANWRSFEEARQYVHSLKLKSQTQWLEYSKSNLRPADIPSAPVAIYQNNGWKGVGDWLGTNSIAPFLKVYRPFNDARTYARNLKLKSKNEWIEFCKSGKSPNDIPTDVRTVYFDDGWIGWGDWLGTNSIASFEKDFISFNKAREFVHQLDLKSFSEWNVYAKSENRPAYIPYNPQRSYKKQGWISWGDWLGTGIVSVNRKEFLDYFAAKEIIKKFNIKSKTEWSEFAKSSKRASNIPAGPSRFYKSNGWVSWGDWLGTSSISSSEIKYLSFEEVKIFVKNLGIKTQAAWRKFASSPLKPNNIPYKVERTYADKGWISWADFLGKE